MLLKGGDSLLGSACVLKCYKYHCTQIETKLISRRIRNLSTLAPLSHINRPTTKGTVHRVLPSFLSLAVWSDEKMEGPGKEYQIRNKTSWRALYAYMYCCTNLDFVIQQLSDEDDFKDVKQEVIDLAGRWQDLGSSLGVRQSDLDSIQLASAHSPSECLRKMVILWLRQSYNVRTIGSYPNLSTLFIL